MRKIIYSQYLLSPIDLGFGPSKRAFFEIEAGPPPDPHESFNMSLYRRHFTETREEIAEKLGLPTTALEVRAEARLRVRHNIYEPNLQAHQIENSGLEEYEGTQKFTVDRGEIRYLNPDGTLSPFTFSGFHERLLNDKDPKVRQSYSAVAHKTDLLAQTAIVQATSSIEVTKLAHDVNGIRDTYSFVYDPVANIGSVQVKNMGKPLPSGEAHERMVKIFADGIVIKAEEGVQVLTKASSVSAEKILHSYRDSVEEKVAPHIDLVRDVSDTAQRVGVGLAEEIRITSAAVGDFIGRKIHNQRVEGDTRRESVYDEISAAPVILKDILTKPENAQVLEVLSTQDTDRSTDNMTEVEIVVLWRQKAEEILGINPEQSQELLVAVEAAWGEMTNAQEIIKFVVDTDGVGIGAALLALEMLAAADFVPAVDVEINQSDAETALSLTQQQEEIIGAFFSTTGEEAVIQKEKIKTDPQFEGVDFVVLSWTRDLIVFLDALPAEEMVAEIEKEEERVAIQIGQLSEILAQLVLKQEDQVEEDRTGEIRFIGDKVHGIEEIQSIEKSHEVEQFSFAVTLWLLLKVSAYHRSVLSLKELVVSGQGGQSLLEKIKEKIPEGLVQQETTQWLLLAIIWHLAMIREQAFGQGGVGNHASVQKKSKKISQKTLIPHGVIFAYAS